MSVLGRALISGVASIVAVAAMAAAVWALGLAEGLRIHVPGASWVWYVGTWFGVVWFFSGGTVFLLTHRRLPAVFSGLGAALGTFIWVLLVASEVRFPRFLYLPLLLPALNWMGAFTGSYIGGRKANAA
jgi:hypothetical protein